MRDMRWGGSELSTHRDRAGSPAGDPGTTVPLMALPPFSWPTHISPPLGSHLLPTLRSYELLQLCASMSSASAFSLPHLLQLPGRFCHCPGADAMCLESRAPSPGLPRGGGGLQAKVQAGMWARVQGLSLLQTLLAG